MEKITIKKLDNTTSEINLVTAFSLEDNNIIIYLTNENPDIVNVAVKTAVGLDLISDELFQKLTEALQTRNAELNNSVQTLQQYNALQALINPITAKLDYLECIIPPRPVPAYQAYPYGYNNGYGCNNGCGCPASTTVTPA